MQKRRLSSPTVAIAIAAILAAILFIAALAIGPVTIAVPDVLASVWAQITGGGESARQDPALGSAYNVVATIRLPRAIIAALVGAALAVAGTVMQAVFRNPLADPGIIGVSAGAATAAVLAIVTGFSAVAAWALPASAFLGALGAVAIVQLAAAMRGGGPATLVLVGIALSAFLGAVTAAAIANAPSDSDIRGVAFWLNGDLVARTWEHVAIASLPILLGIVLLLFFSRDLNILLMGDQAARTTGVNVRRVRVVTLTVAALITASAVAVSGVIGFVGLVVPHLIRLIIGPNHKALLPTAALAGAAFLLAADTIARMLFAPVTLQTGTVVAFIGSPIFLWLLLRGRRPAGWSA